ncbi:MAG: cell division protein FtsQ [Bacteroidota bacterium]
MNESTLQMLKRLMGIACLFLLAAAVISAAQLKGSRNVQEVMINIEALPGGHSLVSKKDLMLSIERSFGHNLIGVPLAALNVERIERVLEADPFILASDVYIDAENQVHISVEQREPIVRIIDKNGLNYYLDEFGEKMPLSKHFTARVLVANGEIPAHIPNFLERKKHTLKDLFGLTNIILDDDFLRPMIEQVYVDKRGEYTLVPKLGNQKILLGRLDGLDDKLTRLKTFYKEGMPYSGWKKYKAINLKYKGQVVCKKS